MTKTGLTVYDPHSFANLKQCVVTHLHLDVEIDFERKVLAGFVDLTCEKRSQAAKSLVLDTQDLNIKRVTQCETGKPLEHDASMVDPLFGTKLEIELPSSLEESALDKIRVEYETNSCSSALQWLTPEQTAGKRHPYLYSHCEASLRYIMLPIHARAMLPCQDTPGIKATYTAAIRAPKALTVLMSAVRDGEEESGDGLTKVTRFTQKVPIPAYLLALVAGCLENRKLGPRCSVWAEKECVDLAVIDFEDTELMLTTAESLVGEYVWGVYDLLVLPPSFPYGGMENPCLTFVTPTLLAGDKSLANVIAHEIAHSWTGNLVTNRTFEHFWLNEGFTMFLERKIIGRMFGDDTRQFQALGGVEDLLYAVETLGADNPLTSLVPCLLNVHPDEAFSSIPYEKGHTFLYYLEELLGGPEVFNPFLKSYIEKFKFKSIDTLQWKEYLFQYFKDKEDVLSAVDWEAWLHAPGLPPKIPSYHSESVKQCEELCKRWADPDGDESKFSAKDIADFKPWHTELFLSFLLREKPLSGKRMALLTQLYNMEEVRNSEIKFRWLRLGLCAKWEPVVSHVTKFLRSVGRMKFVCPLFRQVRDLHAWEEQRPLSISLFHELKPRMMHAVVCKLSKDLALSS
ncbi:unnamed protein product [Ixodes hexagonus]